MKRMFSFLALLSLFLLFLFTGSAAAIPSLGVAPTDGGWYLGEPEDYKSWFVDPENFIPFSGDEGFSIPADGGSLTVWAGYSGEAPKWWGSTDEDVGVWLFTNNQFGLGFEFSGESFDKITSKKISGYHGSYYYGVNLGKPWSASGWSDPPETSPFYGDNLLYKFYTGDFSYGENFEPSTDWVVGQDWLFVVAGEFSYGSIVLEDLLAKSPATSSSGYPVPEPATMLLLGSGLIGLAAVGRKKFRKKS